MEEGAIAYCGLNCVASCPEHAYPELCAGCQHQGERQLWPFCATCAIRACASARGMPACAYCPDYPSCTVDLWQKFPILRKLTDQLRADLKTSPVV